MTSTACCYRLLRTVSNAARRSCTPSIRSDATTISTRTCELAGFGAVAEIDRDLVEWNYGEYEGRLTADIHRERPEWQLFGDGCPGGESPNEVGVRADQSRGADDSRDLKYPKVSASKLKELATAKRTIGHEMIAYGNFGEGVKKSSTGQRLDV